MKIDIGLATYIVGLVFGSVSLWKPASHSTEPAVQMTPAHPEFRPPASYILMRKYDN